MGISNLALGACIFQSELCTIPRRNRECPCRLYTLAFFWRVCMPTVQSGKYGWENQGQGNTRIYLTKTFIYIYHLNYSWLRPTLQLTVKWNSVLLPVPYSGFTRNKQTKKPHRVSVIFSPYVLLSQRNLFKYYFKRGTWTRWEDLMNFSNYLHIPIE